jgi:ribose transport system ATP-binding protein
MAQLASARDPGVRLEMQAISKRFGATIALEKVDFTVKVGEIHALVGENGAGKSTLMKVLSGAHQPDSGAMYLDGEVFRPKGPLDARQLGVGMIYQELSLAPHMTVEENILLGMEPARGGFIKWDEVRERTLQALRYFDHPEIAPDSRVQDLSIGAQQLVEIGRALAVGCKVLVFDEPTSSLSQKDIASLFRIIRELKDDGMSIVYISHFLEEVEEIADRLTVLRDGSVVGTRSVGEVTADEIVSMMVGREVKDLYPRSQRKRGDPILDIRDLAGLTKPEHASLTLHRGEVLGICGLIGAGRTEFLRAVFGLDPVRKGEIKLGIHAGPASPLRRWLQGMGMLSEDRKEEGLALNLTIADNVTLSKLSGFGRFGIVMPFEQEKATKRWIERMDIRCRDASQKVADLSGGNQQKVALARLLQHDVDVLLLDEPTRGIDVAAKAKIYEVIDDLVSANLEEPKAVLVVSSYLPELLGICDRIAVMSRGRLSVVKEVKDVDEHKLMLAATGQQDLN